MSGDEHSRPDHLAHGYQVPHGEIGLVRRVQIADCGDASFESPASVVLRKKHHRCRTLPLPLRSGLRSRLPIPGVSDMGMKIDQPRQAEICTKVDYFSAVGNLEAIPDDRSDPRSFDDDQRIGHDAQSVPKVSSSVHRRRPGRLAWRSHQ